MTVIIGMTIVINGAKVIDPEDLLNAVTGLKHGLEESYDFSRDVRLSIDSLKVVE